MYALRGNLGLGTVPALIEQLHRQKASGVLKVTASAISRRLYFVDGDVVFANSELADDRLGPRLLETEVVSRADMDEAVIRQRESGQRLGETLVALGKLTRRDLDQAIEDQVRGIVFYAFALQCGEYVFEHSERPIEEELQLTLPMGKIVLEGIRGIDDPVAIRIGVGSMTDRLIRVGEPDPGICLNEHETFVLSRVDGRISILNLLTVSPLGEMETLKATGALLAVGLLVSEPAPSRRQPEPVGERTQPVPTVDPANHSEESSLTKLTPTEREHAAKRLFEQGGRLFESGKFHDAISTLEEAVRLDESKPAYFCLLGQAMGKNPHWTNSAIEHLEHARLLEADDVEILWQLAQLYDRSDERRDEAIELYRVVLELDSGHFGARSRLASAAGNFLTTTHQ